MIYIAGPIGNGHTVSTDKMQENVWAGEEVYRQLVLKGYAPILPHFSFYPWKRWKEQEGFDIPWGTWVEMDKEYVKTCEFFFYMTPEKYGPSKGASLEYELAKKLGKKIYTTLDEVPSRHAVTL